MSVGFQDVAGLEHYKYKGKWLYGFYFPFSFHKTPSSKKQVKGSEDYPFTNSETSRKKKNQPSFWSSD